MSKIEIIRELAGVGKKHSVKILHCWIFTLYCFLKYARDCAYPGGLEIRTK